WNISTMRPTSPIPSSLMSSSRPTNGLTKVAPARAASSAWLTDKHRLTLTLMPSLLNVLVADSPAGVRGHLTTAFSAQVAISRPSLTIPSVSVATTSALTGPETILQISLTRRLNSFPSLPTRVGFVVTPSSTPQPAISLISSIFAVSRNNNTLVALLLRKISYKSYLVYGLGIKYPG